MFAPHAAQAQPPKSIGDVPPVHRQEGNLAEFVCFIADALHAVEHGDDFAVVPPFQDFERFIKRIGGRLLETRLGVMHERCALDRRGLAAWMLWLLYGWLEPASNDCFFRQVVALLQRSFSALGFFVVIGLILELDKVSVRQIHPVNHKLGLADIGNAATGVNQDITNVFAF